MRRLGASGAAVAEFGLFATSVAAAQAGRFAYSLAVAAAVPLADFSAWALFLAAIAYAPALLLGVLNGMGRQMPYLIGAGRLDEARTTEAVTWWTLAAVSVAIGIVGAGLGSIVGLEPAAIVTAVIGLVLSLAFQVQQFAARSSLRFNRASVQQLALGVATAIASAWLVLGGEATFSVAAAAYAAAVAIAVLVGIALAPPQVGRWDAAAWRAQAAIGVPIMIAGALFTVLVTIDRWIASSTLGAVGAAPYALASVVGSAMLVLPTVLAQQTYPRMAQAYGAGGRDEVALRTARRQGRLSLAVAVPIALAVALVAWLAIPVVLPEYGEAIAPIALVCGGYVALSGFLGYGNYLNVTGRQWRYLGAQATALLIGVVAMAIGASTAGATGVAVGMGATLAAYGGLLWLAATARTG